MAWLKVLLGFLFLLLVVGLLAFYWIIPTEQLEFAVMNNNELPSHSNFVLNASESEDIQFYKNLRYSDSEISYKINNECTLQKRADAERAFNRIENLTVLQFYPVNSGEEISVTCKEDVVMNEKEFFVAGEGGPVNITRAGDFNVIFNGKILLLRQSRCAEPNIATHELLHSLGFSHSSNPKNIMYNITRCNQVIGDNIPEAINQIYSVESNPDLELENVSAVLDGRYLDLNVTIRNNGLKSSSPFELKIYAEEDEIKKISIDSLRIGEGISYKFSNIFVSKLNVEEIEVDIVAPFTEIEKNNNKVRLKVKK